MKTKLQLLVLTSTALGFGGLALAQQPSDGATEGAHLEEVMVTARRVTENLQRVPIAITAVSAQSLQSNNVTNFTDLERRFTGIQTTANARTGNVLAAGTAIRGIRGIVANFAEVPTPINGSALFFDLGNVQALKGPQGTLFGLSANGGIILYEPQKPTENLEGYAQYTVGEFSRRSFEGVVNMPMMDGKLLVRLGAQVHDEDGFVYDLSQKRDIGDDHYWITRASVTMRPTENFENYLIANYYDDTNHGEPSILTAVNPRGAAAARFGLATLEGLLAQQTALGFYDVALGAPPSADGTLSLSKQWNIVDNATWNFSDNLTFKNILGYTSLETSGSSANPYIPLDIVVSGVSPTEDSGPLRQISEEFQVQGRLLDSRLTYTLGTYHQFTDQLDPEPLYSINTGNTSGVINDSSAKTHAVFGQATYDFSDLIAGLKLTAGYRYNWDKRSASQIRLTAAGVQAASFTADATFTAPGYTFSATYELTPDVMFFVTNSKGYSSGGFNLTAPEAARQFDPESLNNLEVGVKAQWTIAGMEARTNLSGYYGWIDGQQVSITQNVPTPTGPIFATITANAATSRIKGLDGEFTLIPFKSLEIYGNFTLLSSHYDSYRSLSVDPTTGIPSVVDLSGRPFLFVPRFKYNIGGQYHLPTGVAAGEISAGVDYSWQQSMVTVSEIHPPGTMAADRGGPLNTTPSFGKLNANLRWDDALGFTGVDASIFVTNVLDNRQGVGQLGAYNSIGVWGQNIGRPRTWGARIRYSF